MIPSGISTEEAIRLVKLSRAHAEAVIRKQEVRYKNDPRFVYDAARAEKAVEFFPKFLRHSRGLLAGKPFILEEWQAAVVRLIFGWKWADSGLRVIRRVYLFVPRKNGKSTFGAGLALLMLIADGEAGAEIYSAAADKFQAGIVFREATAMVAASSALSGKTESFKSSIIVPSLQATYQVLSSDAESKHGLNPHGILFDELHTQLTRHLFDVLRTAVGARAQPLELYMTTAGTDRKSICFEVHAHAEKVNAGFEDPEFLPILFGADRDDEWTDLEVLARANPCLGAGVQLNYLLGMLRGAIETPVQENIFRRLHLNQWTSQTTRWLPMPHWQACTGPISWQAIPSAMVGRRCFLGLDLSTTTDLTALALIFPPDSEEENWVVAWRFFLPADRIREAEGRDGAPYQEWHRTQALIAIPGAVIDYRVIEHHVLDAIQTYQVQEVAYDPWNATALVNTLQEEGVLMVPIRQGIPSLAAPSKYLETLVVSHRLEHGGHPVAEWMAEAVAVKIDDNGNYKPDKEKSGDRIDGIVALVTGLARAIVAGEAPGGSIYDDPDSWAEAPKPEQTGVSAPALAYEDDDDGFY